MMNSTRPVLNLDLDLLRTFVATADLNTFAAAAAAVCRTQSAVSQQMQRLEQLVGKTLFARHGRNKLLTEHGTQLLGYARKILHFNDEACSSLMFSNLQGVLTLGATDETTETILPYLLSRISAVCPRLTLDVRVKRRDAMLQMLNQQEVDLVVSTSFQAAPDALVLRTSPTLWYSAVEHRFHKDEAIPLVLFDEPDPWRDLMLEHLTADEVAWRVSYLASSYVAARSALKVGLGILAAPVEVMNSDLRVLGSSEGLPTLPDTHYLLYRHPQHANGMTQFVFSALQMHQTAAPLSEMVFNNDQSHSACDINDIPGQSINKV